MSDYQKPRGPGRGPARLHKADSDVSKVVAMHQSDSSPTAASPTSEQPPSLPSRAHTHGDGAAVSKVTEQVQNINVSAAQPTVKPQAQAQTPIPAAAASPAPATKTPANDSAAVPPPPSEQLDLADGWFQYIDANSGLAYYNNPSTGETTWIRPVKTSSDAPPPPQTDDYVDEEEDDVLDEDFDGTQIGNWIEYTTDDGLPYYFNTETQETTWETPPEFLELKAPKIVQLTAEEIAAKYKDVDPKVVTTLQSLARVRFAKAVAKKLAKRKDHRNKLVFEVYNTERSYKESLETVSEVFLTPLKWNASHSTKPIVEAADIPKIFLNIESVLYLSTNLMTDLEERIGEPVEGKHKNWTDTTKLGDVFIKYAQFFKMYTIYCEGFEGAQQYLKTLQEREHFAQFLEQIRTINKLDLNSFLIMPVQRIPRYRMLLTDLVKYSEPEHPDYEDLKKGLALVGDVAGAVNTYIKTVENKNKVMSIKEKLREVHKDFELIKPHRTFIKEGELSTKNAQGGLNVHFFWLFNDCLVYGDELEFMKDSYTYRGNIAFAGSWVKDLPNMKFVKNAFQIVAPTGPVTIVAASVEEKKAWKSAVETQIQGANSNNTTEDNLTLLQRCSVTVVGTETRGDKKPYTVYVIAAEISGNKWKLYKRYSEFDELLKVLKAKRKDVKLPELPKKQLFTTMTVQVIENRRVMLDDWLQGLVMKPELSDETLLKSFIALDDSRTATGADEPAQVKIVYFANDDKKTFKIKPSMKAKELGEKVAKGVALKTEHQRLFSLFIRTTGGVEHMLEDDDHPIRVAEGWGEENCSLIYKKQIFFENDDYTDLALKHFSYIQAVDDVRTGNYPTTVEMTAKLAAYNMNEVVGRYDADKHIPGEMGDEIMRYIPSCMQSKLKKNEWDERVISELAMIPPNSDPKLLYLDTVRTLHFFGCTFYYGLKPVKVKEFPNNITLGVKHDGVQVLDPGTKKLRAYFLYGGIDEWSSSPSQLVIIAGRREYKFETKEGYAIVQRIELYKKFQDEGT